MALASNSAVVQYIVSARPVQSSLRYILRTYLVYLPTTLSVRQVLTRLSNSLLPISSFPQRALIALKATLLRAQLNSYRRLQGQYEANHLLNAFSKEK